MRSRLTTILIVVLLAVGVVACDDTSQGLQDDAQDIQEGVEDAVDDLQNGE
ncbi:MAG: hypothetical protein ACR2HR_00080 [Euzebya sp.]